MEELNFVVVQKGVYKRKLKLDDLSADRYIYGMHDRYFRFFSLRTREGYYIFFDPHHIGCGMKIYWNDDIRKYITITARPLATVYDIAMIFDTVRRVMAIWKTNKFYFNNQEYTADQLDGLHEECTRKAAQYLRQAEIIQKKDNIILVPAVKWPLYIDADRIHEFGEKNDTEGYAEYLHRLQNNNYYWCSCHIYSDPAGGYKGVYTVTAGVDTIIALRPEVPLLMKDPDSQEHVQISSCIVRFVTHQRELIGELSYTQFLTLVSGEKLELYDKCHAVLHDFDENRLRELLAKTDLHTK